MAAATCRVEQELAIYQRQVDAEVEHDMAIKEIAEELTKPGEKCDPMEASNFDEALGEVLCDRGYALSESLLGLIKSGDHAGLAKKLTDVSTKYWKKRAEEDFAEDELESRRKEAEEDLAYDIAFWRDAE